MIDKIEGNEKGMLSNLNKEKFYEEWENKNTVAGVHMGGGNQRVPATHSTAERILFALVWYIICAYK